MHIVCCVMLYVLAGDVMCMHNIPKCFKNKISEICLSVFGSGYVGLLWISMCFRSLGTGGGWRWNQWVQISPFEIIPNLRIHPPWPGRWNIMKAQGRPTYPHIQTQKTLREIFKISIPKHLEINYSCTWHHQQEHTA